jgi:hypothetical protein
MTAIKENYIIVNIKIKKIRNKIKIIIKRKELILNIALIHIKNSHKIYKISKIQINIHLKMNNKINLNSKKSILKLKIKDKKLMISILIVAIHAKN